MDRLLILFSISAVLAAISPLFDNWITPKRNVRAFANSEITFSILLLFFAIPSYLLAGKSRAFVSGSASFWIAIVAIGLVWFFSAINLSFGRIRYAKFLFYAAILRCLLPLIGWVFSWVSLRYYFKAKDEGEFK